MDAKQKRILLIVFFVIIALIILGLLIWLLVWLAGRNQAGTSPWGIPSPSPST